MHTSEILHAFQDDWYEGSFIPKGTICVANVWYGVRPSFVRQSEDLIGVRRYLNRDRTVYVGFLAGFSSSFHIHV